MIATCQIVRCRYPQNCKHKVFVIMVSPNILSFHETLGFMEDFLTS